MSRQARLRWTAGLHFDGATGAGVSLELDDSGNALGAGPIELVLASLAGCAGMDVISILSKKRQVVREYQVHVEGEQDPSHPRVLREVLVEHVVQGEACDVVAVRRSIELSATKYCPVNAMLASGVTRIIHRYRVRNATGEHTGEVVVTGPYGAGLVSRAPLSARDGSA